MTYAHALRYLTLPAEAAGDPAVPARLRAHFPALSSSMVTIFLLHNRLGAAVARFLTSVFRQAGISVAHVIDAPSIPPRDRFLINGAAIHPPILTEACAMVQKQELWLRRTGQNLSMTAAQRISLVLPRLFCNEGCRILLLEGDPDSPVLRCCADVIRSSHTLGIPDYTVLDASANEIALRSALLNIRSGPHEVICATCTAERFRAVSDACAHSGSRLTLAAGYLAENVLPGNQQIRYRDHFSCLLSCGAPSAGVAAALAVETIVALERAGIFISGQTVATGLASETLPGYLTLCSIHPPVVTAAVLTPDDVKTIADDIAALSGAFPQPHTLWAEEPFAPLMTEKTDLIHTQASNATDGTLFLVGSPSYLEQILSQIRNGTFPSSTGTKM